jgi:hypothetical protein
LISKCNDSTGWSEDPGCLRGNPGNIQGQVSDFWQTLLGETILLPVVYPTTITPLTGSQTHYPVAGFIGAEVCGYHWGNNSNDQGKWSADKCAGNSFDVSAGGNGNYMLLVYSSYLSSGVAGPSTTCGLGDTNCDGNRGISLVK